MADKPITFSGAMVRALLSGRKTMTRGILTGACDYPPAYVHDGVITARNENDVEYRWPRSAGVGDRLWVRERMTANRGLAYFSADGASTNRQAWWKNYDRKDLSPLAMPHWASRLTLVVTAVKVERLQDISEDDCIAEGAPPLAAPSFVDGGRMVEMEPGIYGTPRTWFRELWGAINGPDAWDANPWVVVISFTIHRCNIDAMKESAQ